MNPEKHPKSCTIMGCGGSMGVPVIGCECTVCTSDNPKQKRLRSSVLLKIHGKVVYVDPGPDFRFQCLRAGVQHIDAIILTHVHFDHISGIDDARIFTLRSGVPIPIVMHQDSAIVFRKRYDYLFENRIRKGGVVDLDLHVVDQDYGVFTLFNNTKAAGLSFDYFTYDQNPMPVMGFRFDDFAYVTDIKNYDKQLFSSLKGVSTLVISALRHERSPIHFSIEEAIAFANRIEAKEVYLTHLGHEVDYDKVSKTLPENIDLAYDLLCIPF